MAKRRKKRTSKKAKLDATLVTTIKGFIITLIAIIGCLPFGPVSQIIRGTAAILVGVWWIVLLLIIGFCGLYMLFNSEKPKYLSVKSFGILFIFLALTTISHLSIINDLMTTEQGFNINNDLIDKVIVPVWKNSIDFAKGTYGLGLGSHIGGGMIGAFLSAVMTKLLTINGAFVISVIVVILGITLVTGMSIKDIITNANEERKARKEEKEKHVKKIEDDEDDEEDDDEDNKKVINRNDVTISTGVPKTPVTPVTVSAPEPEDEETNSNYQLPSIDLLNKPKEVDQTENEKNAKKNETKLEKVLADFGISGKVKHVNIGPTVSQYEVQLTSGTRVNKITSINREIALALAKKDVRIEAPIPGKTYVGIEFANDVPSPVSFREIIESEEMQKNLNKKLMVPLGKTIMGEIGVCEINKMPHMLIAGTTGSGKSVCVNGIICSILMRARPDEVKLVMVDPKVVELSVYNGIPHLLCPVVTDPRKADIALQKMVAEMERRYDMFSQTGTKNIESYNEYIDNWNKDHNSEIDKKKRMPFIVVIIDELSDLMMVAAKSVEDSILRITQKARAAGIHLIVATQRPSTEVITGLIKANIPSRISFAVGSGIDSRTILDQIGAEKLLGKGDMLYLPIGTNSPVRIQGSFITDGEIKKLIDHCVGQQKAHYDETITQTEEEMHASDRVPEGADVRDATEEPLYNEIVDFVVEQGKASTSLLQRRFKIGYNRAARCIDLLEERGIVGPQNGSKPREVLVRFSDSDEGQE